MCGKEEELAEEAGLPVGRGWWLKEVAVVVWGLCGLLRAVGWRPAGAPLRAVPEEAVWLV